MKTSHGIYKKSDIGSLVPVFKKYVGGKKFLDLGAGSGEVVALAYAFGAEAFGYEADIHILNTRFCGMVDFFEADWNKYDVVYYYIFGSDDEKVRQKLKEFNGIAIIHAHTIEHRLEVFCRDFEVIDKTNKTWVIKCQAKQNQQH